MAQIKEIHIRNFKFFTDDTPPLVLNDGSSHVLLYGENGSGKSTLNWALFTLLESANKEDPSDIAKYFDDRNPENLLNIHSPSRATDAFVQVKLDDGTEWQIPGNPTVINSDRDAKNSNWASDFINYRMLYRLLDFRNSQDIDLFPLFEAEVFDYLNFGEAIRVVSTADSEFNISKVWKQIKQGPEMTTVGITTTYPTSGPALTILKTGVEKFTEDLKKIIADLNPKANEILKSVDGLDIDVDFRIELLELKPFQISADSYHPPKFRIDLKVEKVGGTAVTVTTNIKPHIFLNEARLTAIGLAIRLSILEKRLAVAKLKLLVLDDLLISLDMGNRMKVVNMILKDYCPRYQIFMMTHDRVFYDLIKFRIEQDGMGSGWNFWEAFNDSEGDFEKPFFKLNQSSLSRAEALFHEHDYPASGNYLRKAVEEFVDKWLPPWLRYDNKSFKEHDLSKKLNIGKKFLRDSGINNQLINDLDLFRKFILNAASHASQYMPIFKPELALCIKTLKADMPKFQYKCLLEKNEKVFWTFTNRSAIEMRVEVTVFDLHLLRWDTDYSELSSFLGKIEVFENGEKKNGPEYGEYTLKGIYTRYLQHSSPTLNTDFWEEVKLSGGASLKTKRAF